MLKSSTYNETIASLAYTYVSAASFHTIIAPSYSNSLISISALLMRENVSYY